MGKCDEPAFDVHSTCTQVDMWNQNHTVVIGTWPQEIIHTKAASQLRKGYTGHED